MRIGKIIVTALCLALLCLGSAGVSFSQSPDLAALQKAAEQGNAAAQYELSLLYWRGESVAENSVEAARLMRAAADQGLVEAQAQYGHDLYNGNYKHMPKDEEGGLQYLKLAGQGGHRYSALLVARDYHREKDDAKASIEWYKRAANGNIDAVNALYYLYLNGGNNLSPNIDEALFLLSHHKEIIEKNKEKKGAELLQKIVDDVSDKISEKMTSAILGTVHLDNVIIKGENAYTAVQLIMEGLFANLDDIHLFLSKPPKSEVKLLKAMFAVSENRDFFKQLYESDREKYKQLRLDTIAYTKDVLVLLCVEKLPSGKTRWEEFGNAVESPLGICEDTLRAVKRKE